MKLVGKKQIQTTTVVALVGVLIADERERKKEEHRWRLAKSGSLVLGVEKERRDCVTVTNTTDDRQQCRRG